MKNLTKMFVVFVLMLVSFSCADSFAEAQNEQEDFVQEKTDGASIGHGIVPPPPK